MAAADGGGAQQRDPVPDGGETVHLHILWQKKEMVAGARRDGNYENRERGT
jgi:hypothetical protein